MNRTGLIIALVVAAVVGLVFGIYPELDLRISELFFNSEKKEFSLLRLSTLAFLRDAALWLVTALVVPAIVALIGKLVFPARRMLIAGRAAVFLVVTMALAPGLVANVILKDNWGRSRPVDVPQFNGSERFTPWWDPRGGCPKNCSFVSGDVAGAFWTFAPAALAPPAWRPLAYGAVIAFGSGVGILRMSFGGHFISDIVFAGVFTYLIVWLMYAVIYRWRPTRFSDEAVERFIARIAPTGRRVQGEKS